MQINYSLLNEQLRAFSEISSDWLPMLANASALLYESLPDINWAGFYLVRDGALLLGPFQGKTACVRIEKGRGVCGTAWEQDAVLVVPDVHEFPGHIACDCASRSEIVIPIHHADRVWGVLDIDSPVEDRFSDEDRRGLEEFVKGLENIIFE